MIWRKRRRKNSKFEGGGGGTPHYVHFTSPFGVAAEYFMFAGDYKSSCQVNLLSTIAHTTEQTTTNNNDDDNR